MVTENPIFKTPADLTIVAVGGCGKRLTDRICEHEWFLKQYLGDNKRSLQFEVYDTDTDERKGDNDKKDTNNDYFNRLQKSQTGFSGKILYNYYYIPELAEIEKVSSFAAKEICLQIKARRAEPLVPFWWMNDPENNWKFSDLKKVDPNIIDDFGGGVHRRRAIAKAIFYKCITQSDHKISSFQGNNFAIIVGLGGGTGSGMFIDIAKYIRARAGDEAKIWLFAMLPALTESDAEQLNAAIALTELEYLNLTEKLFNYVVLSSLNPTGFSDGKEKRKDVMEFDNAFPYLFINALHLPLSDSPEIISKSKQYSGFIFADSHVIEYPIEELQKLKTGFESAIDNFADISKNRTELTRKIDEFVNIIKSRYPEHYEKSENADITQIDIATVRREIQKARRIWDSEMTGMLKYKTPDEINFYINNNLDPRLRVLDRIDTYADLIEFVDRLKNHLGSDNTPRENESDKKLYRTVGESLAWIANFATLQKRAANIKEDTTKKSIIAILRGNKDISDIQSEIETQKATISGRLVELDKNKNQLVEDERKSQEEQIKLSQLVDSKCLALVKPVTDYLDQKQNALQIKEIEKLVREKFHITIGYLKQLEIKSQEKNPPVIKKPQLDRDSNIAELERTIDSINDPLVVNKKQNLKLIAQNLSLYYYRKYGYQIFVKHNQDPGRLKKIMLDITKIIFGDDKEELNERNLKNKVIQAENSVRQLINEWNGLIAIRTPFEIDFSEGFLSTDSNQKVNQLKQNIITQLSDDLEIGSADIDKLTSCFEKDDANRITSELNKTLNAILIEKKKFDEKSDKIKITRENLVNQQNELNRMKKLFEEIKFLVEDTNDLRRKYNNSTDELESKMKTIDEKKTLGFETLHGKYHTRLGEINPRVLTALTNKSFDLSSLDTTDDGKNDIEKLKNLVDQKSKEIIDDKKLGINQLSIPYTTPDESNNWCFENVAMVIASPSQEISKWVSNHDDEFKHNIQKRLSLKLTNDVKVKTHNFTRPWEVSLTLFVTASFLDNISPLMAGGGYWGKYEMQQDNILHHVLMLQNGKYLVRNKLLNLTDAAEKANIERFDKHSEKRRQVIEEIKSLYVIKNLQDAVRK
jgi:hypothetical protein